jgi:hypothetical protein
MEAVKPLVVLVLFGTILYGAYSVVQKGPSGTAEGTTAVSATDAPPFAAATASPNVEFGGPPVSPSTPGVASGAGSATVLPGVAAPPAAATQAAPVPLAGPSASGLSSALPPLPPPHGIPAAPPPPVDVAALAAGAAAAAGAAGATNPPTGHGDTYLTPSATDGQPPATGDVTARPDRFADVGPRTTFPVAPPQPPVGIRTASPSSAAFAAAWADAHGKLTAGRYAEALAGLSVWYDEPSLGLEESQQLEDLLGRLAGTVVYSQQDLLLPPHVVAPGETLAAIAAPLGVSTQLLAKINGVEDPARLVPGEHIKVFRGPFDAVLSVSRRRLSLQLNGSYAGSFPVAIGREYVARVGSILPVSAVGHGAAAPGQPATAARRAITLDGGLVIEAADDPSVAADATPASSLVVSVRDLGELIDILGPGSRILVRQ